MADEPAVKHREAPVGDPVFAFLKMVFEKHHVETVNGVSFYGPSTDSDG